jgi:hypothetical protein
MVKSLIIQLFPMNIFDILDNILWHRSAMSVHQHHENFKKHKPFFQLSEIERQKKYHPEL